MFCLSKKLQRLKANADKLSIEQSFSLISLSNNICFFKRVETGDINYGVLNRLSEVQRALSIV